MTEDNPCFSCGACCGFFRVSFYWTETDPSQGGRVPPELTDDLPPYFCCMKGTNQPHPRCIVLKGTIGQEVRCSIYPNVSSTCLDFGIHYENGQISAEPEDLRRCNHARASFGLPPIQLLTQTCKQ